MTMTTKRSCATAKQHVVCIINIISSLLNASRIEHELKAIITVNMDTAISHASATVRCEDHRHCHEVRVQM